MCVVRTFVDHVHFYISPIIDCNTCLVRKFQIYIFTNIIILMYLLMYSFALSYIIFLFIFTLYVYNLFSFLLFISHCILHFSTISAIAIMTVLNAICKHKLFCCLPSPLSCHVHVFADSYFQIRTIIFYCSMKSSDICKHYLHLSNLAILIRSTSYSIPRVRHLFYHLSYYLIIVSNYLSH